MKKIGHFLKNMPKPLAIGIMVVLIVAGLAMGNGNALHDAMLPAKALESGVTEMITLRVQQADDLLILARRYIPKDAATQALQDARDTFHKAKPTDLMTASSALTIASANVVHAMGSSPSAEDAKRAQGALDELSNAQTRMRRAADQYNTALSAAQSLYNRLPTRFLQGGSPEGYK